MGRKVTAVSPGTNLILAPQIGSTLLGQLFKMLKCSSKNSKYEIGSQLTSIRALTNTMDPAFMHTESAYRINLLRTSTGIGGEQKSDARLHAEATYDWIPPAAASRLFSSFTPGRLSLNLIPSTGTGTVMLMLCRLKNVASGRRTRRTSTPRPAMRAGSAVRAVWACFA